MTEGTEAITTIHFVWMAALAALVVIAIVVGMRMKRRRIEAERQVEAHAEEAGVEMVQPSAGDPPVLSPVAPAPPPIADAPVAGTPPLADAPPEPRSLADEPIAAAVAPEGTTATLALDADASGLGPSPADGPITLLKGLGPKVAARLGELGIDRVGQIAALDEAQIAELDAQMGPFAGRIARDRWIEQAQLLASGDREGFERVFGRL